ncbi:cysteine-rich CWC family protein [Saprospira grandis]|nr:cysteine-rich CWC family protein [Saprospira grandis]
MKTECPSCHKSFECQPENISNCQCVDLVIGPALRAHLAKSKKSCYCATCLRELNTICEQAAREPLPQKAHEFVEGKHFYKENGLWIFSKYYLIQRGYCCGNGCKHCPY